MEIQCFLYIIRTINVQIKHVSTLCNHAEVWLPKEQETMVALVWNLHDLLLPAFF